MGSLMKHDRYQRVTERVKEVASEIVGEVRYLEIKYLTDLSSSTIWVTDILLEAAS